MAPTGPGDYRARGLEVRTMVRFAAIPVLHGEHPQPCFIVESTLKSVQRLWIGAVSE